MQVKRKRGVHKQISDGQSDEQRAMMLKRKYEGDRLEPESALLILSGLRRNEEVEEGE